MEISQKNKKKEKRDKKGEISRRKIWCWRLIVVLCIVSGWIVLSGPILPRVINNPAGKHNISQNEILLGKLNLSNVSVFCPESYTFSPIEQRCSTICGYNVNYPLALNICKRVLLGTIAVINTVVTVIAIYRLVRYRKDLKFQHHPIFIGVIINLFQAVITGVPDLIGANLFFCEGKNIDYATLNANPPIHLHIQGFLLTIFSLSNRLWFVFALVLIFLSTFTFKQILQSRRNRIIIILVEIAVCVLYPLVCGLASFIPFSGYRYSSNVLLPLSANRIVGAVFGYTPHQVISGLTITFIVLAVYRIHSQLQIASTKTGKKANIHPIEKRLIFFSFLYYFFNLFISLSLIASSALDEIIENKSNDYTSYLTLNSPFSFPNSTAFNKTLTLLSTKDQQLVEHRDPFFIVFIVDLNIRTIFILVLSVLNFSCPKYKSCSRKKNIENQEISNVVINRCITTRTSIDMV